MKKFIFIILIFYFVFIIFISILILNRNKYGVTEFNNKILVNITNKNKTNKYLKGDLVILNTVDFDSLKKDDEVFIYDINNKNKVNIIISNIESISTKDNKYFIIKNNSTKWTEKYLAGVYNKSYSKIGDIINFFENKWAFLFLLIVPCLVILLLEIYLAFLKKDNSEEPIIIEQLEDEIENTINETKIINRSFLTSSDDVEILDELSDDEIASLSKVQIDPNFNKVISKLCNNITDKDVSDIVSNEEENQSEEVNEEQILKEKNKETKYDTMGKNEVNFIKKIISVKEKEMIEIVNILVSLEITKKTPTTLVKRTVTHFIKSKYILCIDYNEEEYKNKDEILRNDIKEYISKIKLGDLDTKKAVFKAVHVYDKLLNKDTNQLELLQTIYKDVDIDKIRFTLDSINEIFTKINKMINDFNKSTNSNVFNIELHETVFKNVYNSEIVSQMKFSKIFSDYIIDKSYKQSLVQEQLQEVQLKLLSQLLIQELLNNNINNKYLIYFNDTLYSKEKRLKTILTNINDLYSEGKIIILITYDILENNYPIIKKLNSKGYHFALEITLDNLNNKSFKKNNVLLCDFIYVIGNTTLESLLEILPNNMANNIKCTEESLIKEVIIK
jgi:hypothetical protein